MQIESPFGVDKLRQIIQEVYKLQRALGECVEASPLWGEQNHAQSWNPMRPVGVDGIVDRSQSHLFLIHTMMFRIDNRFNSIHCLI